MIQSGMIVRQDYTMIRDRLDQHNRERLSVVLYSDIIDDKEYVATCPITRSYSSVKKWPDNYCYVGYMVYDLNRLSIVKINDLKLYPINVVHPTGIIVEDETLKKIYRSIMNFKEPCEKQELYGLVRDYIESNKLAESLKEEKRRKKLERNLRRREAKRLNINF